MIRGGKNYKKKTQYPSQDLDIMSKLISNSENTPPTSVKQPYATNQPYRPIKLGGDNDSMKKFEKEDG